MSLSFVTGKPKSRVVSHISGGATLRNFSQAHKESTTLHAGYVVVVKTLWRQEHQPCAIQRSNSTPGDRWRLFIGHLYCISVDSCPVHKVFFTQRLLGCLFLGEQPTLVSALRTPPQHLTNPTLQENLSAKPHREHLQRIHHRAVQEIWMLDVSSPDSIASLFGSLLRTTPGDTRMPIPHFIKIQIPMATFTVTNR
jgi:hypothetical protein